MDIKDEYKNLSPIKTIELMWNTSTGKGVAYNYVSGAIDALRCVNAITEKEYNELHNRLYRGEL